MRGTEIGEALKSISKAYYGDVCDNSLFGGGNPGAALAGAYIRDGLVRVAEAIEKSGQDKASHDRANCPHLIRSQPLEVALGEKAHDVDGLREFLSDLRALVLPWPCLCRCRMCGGVWQEVDGCVNCDACSADEIVLCARCQLLTLIAQAKKGDV